MSDAHMYALDNTEIECVQQYKYLAIWLDCDLSFRPHILNLASKLKPKLGSFIEIGLVYLWRTERRSYKPQSCQC
uniref:Uncharacterized protein n=1 Tax=Anguilla anguilla TaxID=7936 RepID=A0A0E9SZE8_ANGAN